MEKSRFRLASVGLTGCPPRVNLLLRLRLFGYVKEGWSLHQMGFRSVALACCQTAGPLAEAIIFVAGIRVIFAFCNRPINSAFLAGVITDPDGIDGFRQSQCLQVHSRLPPVRFADLQVHNSRNCFQTVFARRYIALRSDDFTEKRGGSGASLGFEVDQRLARASGGDFFGFGFFCRQRCLQARRRVFRLAAFLRLSFRPAP